ncbi:MAG: glycosyltransferase family 39 protein [bacterium]|nr:glycosyltransferase family 39 protein [bacterium]
MRKKIILLLFVLLIVRLPTFIYPIVDEDEGIHAVIAADLVSGNPPYLSNFGMQFPLIWYQYAGVFKLFGLYNMRAVHVYTSLVVFLTAILLWQIGKKLKDEQAGFYAALFYILFTTASDHKILASNSEIHLLIFECAALYFVLLSKEKERPFLYWFLAGSCAAGSFLTKQQGGMILASLPIAYWFSFKTTWRRFFQEGFGLVIGLASVLSLFVLFAKSQGYFEAMIHLVFVAPFEYIQQGAEKIISLRRTGTRVSYWVLGTVPLWIAALSCFREIWNPQRRFPLILLLASFVPISMGGRFYMHYFLLMLPSLCLLAALSGEKLFRDKRTIALTLLPISLFFLEHLFMPQVKERMGIVTPDYAVIGEEIQKITGPEEKIFVWGWAPEFYLYSKRLPASRFTESASLSGRPAGSPDTKEIVENFRQYIHPKAWEMLKEDFSKTRPAVIVDAATPNIHNYKYYPIKNYPYLQSLLDNEYERTEVDGVPIYRLTSPR